MKEGGGEGEGGVVGKMETRQFFFGRKKGGKFDESKEIFFFFRFY